MKSKINLTIEGNYFASEICFNFLNSNIKAGIAKTSLLKKMRN